MLSGSAIKLLNSNFIHFLHQPMGFGKGDNDFLVMKYIFEIQGAVIRYRQLKTGTVQSRLVAEHCLECFDRGEQVALLANDPKALYQPLRDQVKSFVTGLTIARLAGTIEFRFGEPLGLNPTDLQGLDWKDAASLVEERLHSALQERRERLLGKEGQITRDVPFLLEKYPAGDEQSRLHLLSGLAQGTRTFFDAKTHQQVKKVFLRLQYVFYAGEILRRHATDGLVEEIFTHLNQARAALRSAYQESEAARLGKPVDSEEIVTAGKRIQNQISRQVLLGAITELWVDYLTRVEALRVSVGLEAYAQRDPLVQYKGKASEMFQTLVTDIRAAVISRIFLYRPRTAVVSPEPEMNARESGAVPQFQGTPQAGTRMEKKRKRHRH